MRLNDLKLFTFFLLSFLLISCSHLAQIDQSQLNHKAMNFKKPIAPLKSSLICPFGGDSQSTVSAVCTTCAQ